MVRRYRCRWWLATLPLLATAPGCADDGAGSTSSIGLEHVHGLGVDPGDGALFAATHFGVYEISDHGASLRGDLIQDTMGFTIVGDERFLGSGHPDLRNDPILAPDMRPLLGLIESGDRGSTWEPISLQGRVDFHVLASAHGQVYGYDATGARFMVSRNRLDWSTRSHIELSSFAVSPVDARRIIGATPDLTIVASLDGGRTWLRHPALVPVSYLSWQPGGDLWGAGPDGTLWQSADGGETFRRAGMVDGQPTTLLADDDALFIATDVGIYRSADGAATWQELLAMDPP